MHIIVYGKKSDYDVCVSHLSAVPELQYRTLRYTHTDDYDSFIASLERHRNDLDIVIVVADGAEGMEGAMASKRLYPDVSVVWITDDSKFGAQSYRLGCTLFAVKPITEHIMANAISKYRQERVG